jgi:hypothetical protein
MCHAFPGTGDDEVIGYTCGTCSHEDKLTHDSMSTHVPDGSTLCIHSVAVQESQRRKGIALRMLKVCTEVRFWQWQVIHQPCCWNQREVRQQLGLHIRTACCDNFTCAQCRPTYSTCKVSAAVYSPRHSLPLNRCTCWPNGSVPATKSHTRHLVHTTGGCPHLTSIRLLCKDNLIKLYEKAGFSLVGPSDVVHGADLW